MRIARAVCLLAAAAAAQAQAGVTVRVVDSSGARIVGASVVLRDADGAEIARRRTSPEGGAAFPEDGAEAEVAFAGFRRATVAVDGREEVTVTLRLLPVHGALDVTASSGTVAPVAAEIVEPDRVAAADLVDALRAVPGVHAVRRGGTNLEPVVQGLRETQLAMVVDGTRTFAAGPARMDSELSHVDPGGVASVTVVTGPYALTEGAGAMAAILVRSEEVPSQPAWRLGGRFGLGWRGNGGGRVGHAKLNAGNSAFGFDLRAAGNLLGDYAPGSAAGGSAPLVPGDAAVHQFGARVRVAPAADHNLLFGALYDEQTGVDYPGRLLNAEHFLLRAWDASYRWNPRGGLVSEAKLSAYLRKKGHRMSNREKPTAMDAPGRTPPFALAVSLPAESDTAGAAGRVELAPGAAWRVQAGFDVFRLEQNATRFIARASDRRLLFNDAVWAGASLRTAGAYVHVERAFDRGEVRAALRLDSVRSDAGSPSDYFLANAGGGTNRRETNANFSAAGRYDLGGGWTLAGGAGRVLRTANALERYADRFPSTRFQVAAEFLGDPGIRPEASLQGDLGVEWRAGAFRLSASGFVRSLRDYITVAPDPGLQKRLPLSPSAVYRYVNGESAFFRGWTVAARRVSERLDLRFQASKTIADDRELMEPVLGIAPLEADWTVRFLPLPRRFWAEYSVRRVWDQRRVSTARRETPSPGFTLHRLRFGAELGEGSTLYAGIENAGDAYYAEHLSSLNPFTRQRIPEMGRAVTVGFTTAW